MKIKKILLVFAMLLFNVCIINASDGLSVSKSSLSMYAGASTSFKLTANNAAGKVSISSEDSSIATVSSSSIFLDNESTTITVKGIKVGTTNIKIYIDDMTTYNDVDVSGKTYNVKIVVNEKPNYSTNNKLKSISVDGYELTKVDDNNYTLDVSNSVESIKINATAEDSKAKISNTGKHDLSNGENTFKITITSESGSKNVINVKITRKDGFYIEDLKEIISNEDVQITLREDTIIDKDNLNLIMENKKIVRLNYYDSEKNIIYYWTIDGNKEISIPEIKTHIDFEKKDNILKLVNYVEGKYINFSSIANMPEDTNVYINVSDMYEENEKLNVYYIDNNNIITYGNVEVKDGFIKINIKKSNSYIITKALFNVEEEKTNNIAFIIVCIYALIELFYIIYLIYKYIIKKKNNNIELSKSDIRI